MATCALSLIIKRQSYPEPVLLVSASLRKQPLNTFAGLFLLLKQEQQAEVEEKVNFMNVKHVFSLSYIFFGKYRVLNEKIVACYIEFKCQKQDLTPQGIASIGFLSSLRKYTVPNFNWNHLMYLSVYSSLPVISASSTVK